MSRQPATKEPTKDSDAKRPGIELFNILGRGELREARLTLVGCVVLVVLAFLLLGSYNLIGDLNDAVRDAEREKIIFAYPQSGGVFIPAKVMPKEHIRAMVKDFVYNRENYTPQSVSANLREAKRMMTPDYSVKMTETLSRIQQISKNTDITQVMGFTSLIGIEKTDDGVLVTFTAERIRDASGKIYSRDRMEITYKLVRIRPSRHYNWGLMVSDRLKMKVIKKVI